MAKPEHLTEAERERLSGGWLRVTDVTKLLALHDHQAERIRQLERQLQSLAAERDEWARRAKQSL